MTPASTESKRLSIILLIAALFSLITAIITTAFTAPLLSRTLPLSLKVYTLEGENHSLAKEIDTLISEFAQKNGIESQGLTATNLLEVKHWCEDPGEYEVPFNKFGNSPDIPFFDTLGPTVCAPKFALFTSSKTVGESLLKHAELSCTGNDHQHVVNATVLFDSFPPFPEGVPSKKVTIKGIAYGTKDGKLVGEGKEFSLPFVSAGEKRTFSVMIPDKGADTDGCTLLFSSWWPSDYKP